MSLIRAALVVVGLLIVAAPGHGQSFTLNAATQAWLGMWIEAIPNLQIIWMNPNFCARSGILCDSKTSTISIRLDGVQSAGFNFIGTLPEVGSTINGADLQITSISVRGKTRFTGTIPASWSTITTLRFLDFSRTGLSGQVPSELGRLTNLVSADFSNAYFCGDLPSWDVTGMLNLVQARFAKNNLRGSFASSWSTFPDTLSLDITENRLCGCMPNSWSDKPNLVAAANAMDRGTVVGCTRSCDLVSMLYCPTARVASSAQTVTIGIAHVVFFFVASSLIF
ncbi:hypothetical protein JKF63_07447 [Porcisia hertigi]|uniref:Surface antigen-like protein n=1 Tax=Porcisia hertigi TaxID=2761500 RepID=A0A836LKY7_9TRYP|nr:hypothetical protein JKF63_07447 [Porcisia hertigi]